MHSLRIVLGGGIYSIENLDILAVNTARVHCVNLKTERERNGRKAYQGSGSRIDKLMLSASRHDHEVPSFDVLVFTRDGGFADAGGESEGLVDGVDLKGQKEKTQEKSQFNGP